MSSQLSFLENPPYVRGRQTSYRAAQRIRSKSERLRSLILGFLKEHGPATDEEIQEALNIGPDTERPRRRELVKRCLVIDSKEKGITAAGNPAIKWRVK